MEATKGEKYIYFSKIFDEKAKKMKEDLNIPDKDALEWEEAFLVLDEDQSGQIDAGEVIHVMRALGHNVTIKEVEEMIRRDDVSGDGEIDFAEFLLLMWKHHCKEIDYRKDLYKAFKIFDKDDSGTIEKQELIDIVTKLGNEPISEKDAQALIDVADLNHDGKIDFFEFAKMMTGPPSP